MSRRNSGYFVSHPVNLLIHFSLSFRFLSSSRHLEGMAFRKDSLHGTLLARIRPLARRTPTVVE